MHFLELIKKDGNKMRANKLAGGIYLVIDPSMEEDSLFEKLGQVLKEGIAAVQIWDHWPIGIHKEELIKTICDLCHSYQVPVFINNEWKLLNSLSLDGVHFDSIPANYDQIKLQLVKGFLAGLTCNNDLSAVEWAEKNDFDYISFCSIFPSSTSTSCELVSFQTIEQARKITSIPIFLSGGIQLSNLHKLEDLDFDGVALVSGIMSSTSPAEATKQYSAQLTNKKYRSYTKLLNMKR
jgi:thiamine-phosphate pyrophosphorylase